MKRAIGSIIKPAQYDKGFIRSRGCMFSLSSAYGHPSYCNAVYIYVPTFVQKCLFTAVSKGAHVTNQYKNGIQKNRSSLISYYSINY